jgi:ribosomal peptide maturation radical SAM protein 1
MAYRSKSAERVLGELRALSTLYGSNRFFCVDNILDLKYIQTVFPALASSGAVPRLFFETKANLRFDQLAALKDGGVYALQPGIESFSNEILRQMRKGCTGLQNLQFLRWCDELGIQPFWNILFGFPGESPSEYDLMAELVPAISHLPPPVACASFRLDRFSPLFTHAADFGLARVRPNPSYYYAFPLGCVELNSLAYYFDFDYADGRDPRVYSQALSREVALWALAHSGPAGKRPRLDLHHSGDAVLLDDSRPCAVAPLHRLEGLTAEIYRSCDSARTLAALRQKLAQQADLDSIRDALASLLRAKLMVEMDAQFLSLAVMRDRPARMRSDNPHVDLSLQKAPAAYSLLHPV